MHNEIFGYMKIPADRRKTVRIINTDKRSVCDRRKIFRINTGFLVQLKIKTNANSTSENVSGKMIDLSERGCKLLLDYSIPINTTINITINLHSEYPSIELKTKVIWTATNSGKYYYGLNFIEDSKNLSLIEPIFADFENKKIIRPRIQFINQPLNICHKMSGVDFRIGCDYKCLYCYFNKVLERSNPLWATGKTVDISPIYEMKEFPNLIYLSPFSDPFAPSTKELTHEFLSLLLPKGVKFIILTKGIIPDKTVKLFKQYSLQIDIGVGVTNLDEQRNSILEPNCPPAAERLSNLPKLAKTGCRFWVRIDPIIPKIDDPYEVLETTIKGIGKIAVPDGFSSSYLFLTRTSFNMLNKIPLVKESLKFFTEKCPTSTGMALSIPFEEKKAKYDQISLLCKSIGSKLHICSCKDVRFKNLEGVDYNLRCAQDS